MKPHISLVAEKVGNIFGIPITNSIVLTWLVMLALILFAFIATSSIRKIPSTLQSIAEIVVEGLYNLFKSVVGEHYIDTFFPLLATIFLFVAIANWSGLIPGVGSIGFHKTEENSQLMQEPVATKDLEETKKENLEENATFIPIFRGPTADLNTTLAIALIAVSSIQYYGMKSLGV